MMAYKILDITHGALIKHTVLSTCTLTASVTEPPITSGGSRILKGGFWEG